MRKQLLNTIALCAACLALGVQAQTSSSAGGSATDPSGASGSSTTPGTSYGSSSSSQSGWSSRNLSATGRMGQQAVRGSQLTGAQVTSSSGSELGAISDTIINPGSGRLEFAVISLTSGAGGANSGTSTTPGATSTTPGAGSSTAATTPSSSLAGGKQVAVPWMLLRPSPGAIATSAAATQQTSFVFAGDTSKLESAPNFDASTDLSQPSWRQSVFSYFGLSGGSSAIGGAETPSGSSSGSTTPPGTTTPHSSSGNP